jgi:hypothetical protein
MFVKSLLPCGLDGTLALDADRPDQSGMAMPRAWSGETGCFQTII